MPSNVDLSDDPLVTQSREAAEAMETEAAAFFAAKAASQQDVAALNPVAPALEKAARETSSPKAAAASASGTPGKEVKSATGAPSSGAKVPGAPSFAKKEPVKETAETKAADALAKSNDTKTADAKDFSDVPREFKKGGWDRLHEKADHYVALSEQRLAELTTLRAELEAAKAAATSTKPSDDLTARLTALQNERDALRTQLQAVAGERIFDSESKPRRDAALTLAKRAAGPEHTARVEQLLQMGESSARDNALEELIATLPPLRAASLAQAVTALAQLSLERSAAAAQGGELYQRRLSEAAAAQERENQARIARASTTFDAEVREWEPVGLTADELASARSVYSGQGATLQDAARAALWAVAGPRAAAQLNEANARVAELEAQLAKLQSARPSIGAGGTGALPASNGADEDDPSLTSYAERIAREAARAGVRFGVAN